MKLDLEKTLKDAEEYLRTSGLVVFYGTGQTDPITPEIEWDTTSHPDFKQFVDAAKQLEVKLMVLHQRVFSAELIEAAIEQLESSGMEFDEQRSVEKRLRELSKFDGFTGSFDLTFQYNNDNYLFELRAPWFDELNDLLEEMDLGLGLDDEEGGEEPPYGGYYSKN